MPTSAPGSRLDLRGDAGRSRRGAARGFTLIELLVVVAIIALSSALVTLALRDGSADRLEREGQRLATLLEVARAESRVTGLAVWWVPADAGEASGFRFVGLPDAASLPHQWLDPEVQAQVMDRPRVALGPDALIGAQRIELRLADHRLVVGTDGLGPFAIVPAGDGA